MVLAVFPEDDRQHQTAESWSVVHHRNAGQYCFQILTFDDGMESVIAHTMVTKGSSLFLIMGIVKFSSISKVVFSTSFTFPKRKPINQMV